MQNVEGCAGPPLPDFPRRESRRDRDTETTRTSASSAVPNVRIHLPPAERVMRTRDLKADRGLLLWAERRLSTNRRATGAALDWRTVFRGLGAVPAAFDMDSSESPTYGEQEGSAYNGHFGCTCSPAVRIQPIRRCRALRAEARQCAQCGRLARGAGVGGCPLPAHRKASVFPGRRSFRQSRDVRIPRS